MPDFRLKDIPISYTKTDKLITALYMITDIMDPNEPMRLRLRTLGTDLLSDIYSSASSGTLSRTLSGSSYISIGSQTRIINKISEIGTLLNINLTLGMISDMNFGILIKEFNTLKNAVLEWKNDANDIYGFSAYGSSNKEHGLYANLTELFSENESENETETNGKIKLGVQKGSTLMNALKHFEMSDREYLLRTKTTGRDRGTERELLHRGVRQENVHHAKSINNRTFIKDKHDEDKQNRREEIISVIKDTMKDGAFNRGLTITDIKHKAREYSNKTQILSLSEKTLQRELFSMVKDGVLQKTGEKRWSFYFLPKHN